MLPATPGKKGRPAPSGSVGMERSFVGGVRVGKLEDGARHGRRVNESIRHHNVFFNLIGEVVGKAVDLRDRRRSVCLVCLSPQSHMKLYGQYGCVGLIIS